MKLRLHYKKILLITSLFAIFCLFQNCSKIDPKDLGKVAALSDKNTAMSTGGDMVSPQPSSNTNNNATGSDSSGYKNPVASIGGHTCHHDGEKDDGKDYAKDDDQDKKDDLDDDDHEMVSDCLKDSKQMIPAKQASLDGARGSMLISLMGLMNVSDVRGKFIFVGNQMYHKMSSLKSSGGKLVLCNIEIENIEDTQGKIILVNSKVKNIKDHKGNLVVIQSEIDQNSNVTGAIKIVGQ